MTSTSAPEPRPTAATDAHTSAPGRPWWLEALEARLGSELASLELPPCLDCVLAGAASAQGYLARPLPAIDDRASSRVPADLPPVVDAHVHLFPQPLAEAIWRWFDAHAWPVRYRLPAETVASFLPQHGVTRTVAHAYAHRPGIAEALNGFLAELAAGHPTLTCTATVYPGEPGAAAILERAFAAGLAGVKLHCHVQCLPIDGPEMLEVAERCAAHGVALLVHAGREPSSPGYACDPHAICSAERVAHVLDAFPALRLCVPHLGADEYAAYARLLERHDHLWLDTTMVLADYFPDPTPWQLLEVRPDRIVYGSDFPNVPYAWDRELGRIASRRLPAPVLERVLGANAVELYGLAPLP